jgi:hypothetical protein
MENLSLSADFSEDISKTLRIILATVSEKILHALRCEKFSFADLGTMATILQRLIDCHAGLKSFIQNEDTNAAKVISRDALDAIQTQLNLL